MDELFWRRYCKTVRSIDTDELHNGMDSRLHGNDVFLPHGFFAIIAFISISPISVLVSQGELQWQQTLL